MGARARMLRGECDSTGDEEADGRKDRGGGWPRGTGGASLVEETRARRGDRTKSLRPPPLRPLPSPATASATAPSSPSASIPQRPCRAPYLYILPDALQFLPEVEQTLVSLFIALATLDSVTHPTPNAMLYNSERHSIHPILLLVPLPNPSSSSATQLWMISPATARPLSVASRASLNLTSATRIWSPSPSASSCQLP